MKRWMLIKKIPATLALLLLLLTSASCGLRDTPESSADAGNGDTAISANPEQNSVEAPLSAPPEKSL
jgi:hypothetical protein